MAYRQVPHTADIALEIEAPDAKELLACCVSAVSQLLIGTIHAPLPPSELVSWTFGPSSLESLLVRTANECIFLWETRRWAALSAIPVLSQSPLGLTAQLEVRGAPAKELSLEGQGTQLKAATYGGLQVVPTTSGTLRATMILDT